MNSSLEMEYIYIDIELIDLPNRNTGHCSHFLYHLLCTLPFCNEYIAGLSTLSPKISVKEHWMAL